MDVEMMVLWAATIVATAVVAWIGSKGYLSLLMNRLGEIKEKLEQNMDMLPDEAKEVALEILALIEEIKICMADGKITFNEILQMSKQVRELWKDIRDLFD